MLAQEDLRPEVFELERFPSQVVARDQVRRHERHLEHLEKMWLAWPEQREVVEGWQKQTRHNRYCWEMLLWAHIAFHPQRHHTCRQRLDDLRRLLLPWNFEAALMPPAFPWYLHPPPAIPLMPRANNQ